MLKFGVGSCVAGLLRTNQPISSLRRLYAMGFVPPGKGTK